ncbi:hypothetical protein GCM10007276_27050 [Agaricicola taiwanensis]|uniref:VWFA domain-containing protein n=1 Tax=Agaricicola taiwanensis TaxID=591372 RepID=A0A8J2YJL2_9RHOB|nr:ankyrin repeat domain-containing protein [Agaricicola taiwanensis]GGE48485.1 hypothetical protein GCM10007276_27050 [Agaricicola taiwanensis]
MIKTLPYQANASRHEPDDDIHFDNILLSEKFVRRGHGGSSSLEQALRTAAASGDLSAVEDILESGATFDINAVDPETGKTALHYAAEATSNPVTIIQKLLKAGADVTIKDRSGKTAFDLARQANTDADSVSAALATGATEQLRKYGSDRSAQNYWTTFNDLIDAGADVNVLAEDDFSLQDLRYFRDVDKAVELFRAIVEKHPEKLWEDLLDTHFTLYEAFSHFGKERHAPDGTRYPPVPFFERLMKEAADLARSVLEKAIEAGDWERANLLIKERDRLGVDIGRIEIPLDELGQFDDPKEILKAQIESGQIDLATAKVGNFTIYDFFLTAPNWRSKDRPEGWQKFNDIAKFIAEQALAQTRQAFRGGDWSRAIALIDSNAVDVRAEFENGMSLLSHAASKGQLDVVRALVERVHTAGNGRANYINRQDSEGRTALHFAAEKGNKHVYDYLVSQGGKSDVEAGNGQTPNGIQKGRNDPAWQDPGLRAAAGLPPLGETDIFMASTRTKDEDGNYMTVSALSMKKLYDKYKKMLDDGEIDAGDDRAKLVHAIEALSAAQNGLDIMTYLDTANSSRFYGQPSRIFGDDAADIFDISKINKEVSRLLGTADIAEDHAVFVSEAVSEVTNKDSYITKLKELLTSPEYAKYIYDLKKSGKEEEAKADIASSISSLRALTNDETVDDVTRILLANDLKLSLNEIFEDFDSISGETLSSAAEDVLAFITEGMPDLDIAPGSPEADLIDRLNKVLNDGTMADDLVKALIHLIRNGYDGENGDEKIAEAIESLSAAPSSAAQIKELLLSLDGAGVLERMVGLIRLTAGVDKLTEGKFRTGNSFEDIVTVIDFGTYLTISGEPSVLGSGLTSVLQMNMPDPVSKSNPLNKPDPKPNKFDKIWKIPSSYKPPSAGSSKFTEHIDDMLDQHPLFRADPSAARETPPAARIAGSASRIIGATALQALNIIPIVFGAFGIKDGLDRGSEKAVAAGALEVALGGLSLLAGAASVIGIAAGSAAALTVGAAIGGAAGFLLLPILAIVITLQGEDAVEEQHEKFKNWADRGFLQGDWEEKLDFLAQYLFKMKDKRGVRKDKSIFDAVDWRAWMDDRLNRTWVPGRGGTVGGGYQG